jgi:hypothetical protein
MGEQVTVSTSVGVAIYPEDGLDSSALMRSADAAMYVAKSSGRNRYATASGKIGRVQLSGNRRSAQNGSKPKLRLVEKTRRREDLSPVTT